MDYKLNIIDKCKQEVEINLTRDQLEPFFEEAYLKYRKKINIPGFRTGKAPISLLKKMYSDVIENSSLEEVANKIFKDYLEKNNINPIGEGVITELNYTPNKELQLKIEYEILPDFELQKYKDLELVKTIYPVTNEMIEDEIEYLRLEHATYEKDNTVQNEDYIVTADFQELDDSGFPIVGNIDKDSVINLIDKRTNAELKEQLLNVSLNDEKVIKLKDEKNNKFITFRVKIKKIEKIIVPEIDEPFYKIITKKEFSNEEEFRNFIKSNLESAYGNISERDLRNTLVNELIKENDIPVPDSFVNKILDSFIEDIKEKNPKRNLPDDFNEEEYRKVRKIDAIIQAKWYLIGKKIIDTENLHLTEEELNSQIEKESKRFNIPKDKLSDIYRNNQNFKDNLLQEKLVSFLFNSSNITEVVHKDEKILV